MSPKTNFVSDMFSENTSDIAFIKKAQIYAQNIYSGSVDGFWEGDAILLTGISTRAGVVIGSITGLFCHNSSTLNEVTKHIGIPTAIGLVLPLLAQTINGGYKGCKKAAKEIKNYKKNTHQLKV